MQCVIFWTTNKCNLMWWESKTVYLYTRMYYQQKYVGIRNTSLCTSPVVGTAIKQDLFTSNNNLPKDTCRWRVIFQVKFPLVTNIHMYMPICWSTWHDLNHQKGSIITFLQFASLPSWLFHISRSFPWRKTTGNRSRKEYVTETVGNFIKGRNIYKKLHT
jgi:hypothetical protein